MAQLADPDADGGLRTYLLEEAKRFRRQMVETLLDPEHPDWAQYAWDQLTGRVNALESGAPVTISRYELPDGHPMSAPVAGHPTDNLRLDEHNVLRVVHDHDSRLQVRR